MAKAVKADKPKAKSVKKTKAIEASGETEAEISSKIESSNKVIELSGASKGKAATDTANTINATLGNVVMVYTKSSSHWFGLSQPEIVTISGVQFLRGTQVTGKEGHRMEQKTTLIPFDHVASIIQFQTEEDLWCEPQPKHIRLSEDGPKNALLTSHEHPGGNHHRKPHHGGGGRRHRKDRGQGGFKKGNDARFQERYDSRRD